MKDTANLPDWQQITVATSRTALAEAVFEQFEASAITVLDAGDDPIVEPEPHARPAFERARVVGLFSHDTPGRSIVEALHQVLGNDITVTVDGLEKQDWEHAWLAHHPPLCFGDRLWVAPHDTDIPGLKRHHAVVRLDPGLAFGTGTHPTTALCLEWLARTELSGRTVLDYGCGSGILAIAAVKLGAFHVTAVDIDPQAVRATRDNAAANGVGQIIATPPLDGLQPQRSWDIVLGNILARPLMSLAPTLSTHIRPGGQIILSGLLSRHVDDIRTAYRPGVTFSHSAQRDDWVRLDGVRNRPNRA